ncbi:HpcH/HpaI aldolase/citrate lyase family protein [Herbaspirillum sp. B65]|uniref:HpcH/HpaI aldolase/citrate lyase family protein n=1 Tax=Herbaspirillum sp. B65 TaxID=137708 RepID=UPI0003450E06|nr:aldolase/citrate lyase family protein [Herbaspirillum sp. B65]
MQLPDRTPRPPALRRSWLFLAGADEDALMQGTDSGADVLIQEVETFTPTPARAQACRLSAHIMRHWKAAGAVTAVRIDRLEAGGMEDLTLLMAAAPQVVMMSFVSTPQQMEALDEVVGRLERQYGIVPGTTELVPNIESPLGLLNTIPIARASARVSAVLVGTEDMVADIGAQRTREGRELDYVRSRFLIECASLGMSAIDCPYSYTDSAGAARDMQQSLALGFKAKAIVNAHFVPLVNRVLTPSDDDIAAARRCIEAFENARTAAGGKRVAAAVADTFLVEVPDYLAARRLLARAAQFGMG